MLDQAPAYQMYAGDWLKSRNVRLMNDSQRGWYIQLLNEAWDGKPQCMLPKDDPTLMLLAGVSDLSETQPDFNGRWKAVKRMFVEDGEYVYNERQLEELAKQGHRRESAVKAGLASAKKREEEREELQRLKRQHLDMGNGRSTGVQRSGNGNPTLHTPPSDCNLPSPASLIEDSDSRFEEAWKLYDRYGVKKKAKQYWGGIKPDDQQSIIKAIPAYLRCVAIGRSKSQFEGWINPANRKWDVDWEQAESELTKKTGVQNGRQTAIDRRAEKAKREFPEDIKPKML